MNTPPTTAPNSRPSLDSFETALLTELREHVADRPAPDVVTAPVRHPRRYGRWAAGFAVAAATAAAVVIASPGGPGASPAYAVSEDADGDVVVTIHRLEDSAGLEAALREHGIDAEVSYDPTSGDGHTFTLSDDGTDGGVDGGADAPPPGDGGTVEREHDVAGEGRRLDQSGPGPSTDAVPVEPGEEIDPAGCGTIGTEPPTLTRDGGDWELRIPADSPLQDRPVQITTDPDGRLGVFYQGDQPGSFCGVSSIG